MNKADSIYADFFKGVEVTGVDVTGAKVTRRTTPSKKKKPRRRKPTPKKEASLIVPHTVNPNTGRIIRIDGPAFNRLIKNGEYTRKQLEKGAFMKKRASKRVTGPIKLPKGHTKRIMQLPISKQKGAAPARKSKTGGWGARKPNRRSDRKQLYAECGDACFLLPSRLGFPICTKCQNTKNCKCELDCGGVLAAKMRASQWGYDRLARLAGKIHKERCKIY